jgi:AraC family transcriptional regulator
MQSTRATESKSVCRMALQAPLGSGLAPWQAREAKLHIELHLTTKITTRELATLVRLSPYHFSRAFRDSFGDPPHRHVLKQRMLRSQELMLTTNWALADIALECGLSDQAHFVKLFRRFVGTTPGAWRRARSIPTLYNACEQLPRQGTQRDCGLTPIRD